MESDLQGCLQPGLQALLLVEKSFLWMMHGDVKARTRTIADAGTKQTGMHGNDSVVS